MIKLDLQSRLPIYEQLQNRICELVMLGELKADEALPSVRSFARDLGVNPNTVQKAYGDLERNKIIYSVAGRGSYISPEISLNSQLHAAQLAKIKQVVSQGKACGIKQQNVVDAVIEVYKGDNAHDKN